MKTEQIVVPVAALVIGCVVGGALGYTLKPVPAVDAEDPVPVVAETRKPGIEKFVIDENASRDDLRRQYRELQRLIAKMDRESREQAKEGGGEVQVAEAGRRERGDRGNWRERMMREDPERYTAMTNQFAQMQRARLDRAQAKLDFFSAIDTSRMSAADRAHTESLQALIVKREELEAKMRDESLTWDDRRQIGQEMWETHGAIQAENGHVREALIKQIAEDIGYTGEEAATFSQYIGNIVEMTESGGPGGPGGPGGFGGGRGGRGGNGGGRGGRR